MFDTPKENLINLELSQMCDLVHSKSNDDQPGPSTTRDPNELQKLKNELESTLINMVQHEHHKQFMATALRNQKPPPGLTPKINLTAKGQTQELTSKVDNILLTSGLEIVKELHDHRSNERHTCRTKAEEICKKMEEHARNALLR